jgi:eukaryotic-like serine/threonine-protein kinase
MPSGGPNVSDSPSNEPQSTLPERSPASGLGRIGDYLLIQRLGSGGMGEVFEAEQERPVRRRVALKLIKLGMDTREVVARFESERQALALLNHPYIAQVFDGGSTPEGRPYFVMERVSGIPILDYCDRYRLSVDQRLRLFQQVCEAVQHAHQKGIIHRDLKNSNILVELREEEPHPKVIDFGVAKAAGARLTDATLHTQLGQLVGTLEYMSPEQAGLTPLDIDTRTDVYALGVLLYELLVGTRPIEGRASGDTGMLKLMERIQTEEPMRPSSKLASLGAKASDIASQRRTDPTSLHRLVHGDLDWISLKALEKDRTLRYASASELSADLERYLAHEPVVASPPSTLYRVRKFVRRHRLGVVAGTAVGLALLAGVIGTTLMLLRAVKAERTARREAEAARRTTDFLVDLFQVADPGAERGSTITAREILDHGARRVRAELKEQPEIQARLMNTIGVVYRGLGLYPSSRELLQEAVDTRERALGTMSPDVAASLNDLALTLYRLGEFSEGAKDARRALAINEKTLGPGDVQTAWSMFNLANNLTSGADIAVADSLLHGALAIFRKKNGENSLAVSWCLNGIAMGLAARGRFREALPPFTEAARIKEKTLGGNHPDVAIAYNNLAYDESLMGDYADAEQAADHAIDIADRVLGPQHPLTATFLHTKGDALRNEGKLREAEPLLMRAVAIQETRQAGSQELPLSLWTLAAVRAGLGRTAEAEAGFKRSVMLYDAIDPNFPDLAPCLQEFARLYDHTGRAADAAALRARADKISAVVTGSK